MKGTDVLVTGGAGFIGRRVVKELVNRGHSVTVLDLLTYAADAGLLYELIPEYKANKVNFIVGDVRDFELANDAVKNTSLVIHMAAETHVARSLYGDRRFIDTDIEGTHSILLAIKKHRKQLIHISTSEVYGSAVSTPMDIDHPLDPTSPYAAAKAGAELLVRSYVKCYNINATVIRPFNNYGPGQHLEKLIPRLIVAALTGGTFTIHGDGKQIRDWTFVEDFAKALIDALECPPLLEIYNICTGDCHSVLGLVGRIHQYGNMQIEYLDDRLGQVDLHCGKSTVGDVMQTSMTDGLEKTVLWYKEHWGWVERHMLFREVPVKYGDKEYKW